LIAFAALSGSQGEASHAVSLASATLHPHPGGIAAALAADGHAVARALVVEVVVNCVALALVEVLAAVILPVRLSDLLLFRGLPDGGALLVLILLFLEHNHL